MGAPPGASFPIAPPVAKFAVVDPRTGHFTTLGLNWAQQLWAATQGGGGTLEQIQTVFGMHGDGTLSTEGVLIITSSEGQVFVASAFSDTTNAANITSGFLAEARIADQSLPQAKLAGLSDPVLVSALPAPTAGLRAFVSDSTVAASGNFGAIVAGGGGFNVPVFGDGANWLIG